MTKYMKQKVVHKYIPHVDISGHLSMSRKTVCKIENKTYAFKASYRWKDVTCKRCLQ